MRKALIMVAMAMLAFGLVIPNAYAEGEWDGNTNFFLGGKTLDKNEWEPVEEQGEFGIMVDFGKEEWPAHIAIDLMVSATEEQVGWVIVEGSTVELDFGVRKPFDFGNMHPFVGGGLGIMSGYYEIVGFGSCEGSGGGVWADAGIYWTLGQSFNLGFDARVSSSETEYTCSGGGTVDANTGGGHFGLLLGYHWK